jgi:hypothetical protein
MSEMNDRDLIAIVAMAGMLASGYVGLPVIPSTAYSLADEMLKEKDARDGIDDR